MMKVQVKMIFVAKVWTGIRSFFNVSLLFASGINHYFLRCGITEEWVTLW